MTLVLRVYNLKVTPPTGSSTVAQADPKFNLLVDPIKLMQGGQATVTALGGFSMNVTQEGDDPSGT